MADYTNIANGAGSAIGSILAGILGQGNVDWSQGMLSNVYNLLSQGNQTGLGIFQQTFPQLFAAGNQNLTNLSNSIYGNENNPGQLDQLLQQITGGYGSLNNFFSPGINNSQQLLQMLGSGGPNSQLNDAIQQAQGQLQNHGQNPTTNWAQEILGNFGSGNSSGQHSLNQLGNALITNPGNYGQNQYTQNLQNFTEGVMGQGGVNPLTALMQQYGSGLFNNANNIGNIPNINNVSNNLTQNPNIGNIPNLTNAANNILGMNANGTPGQTQTGAAGERAALQGFLSGGNNDASNYLLNRGKSLANDNPLLPTNYVYNLARDQAAQQNLQQERTAREQAQARSGTTGPTVAAGSGNAMFNETLDKALQNEATAGQNALVQQQGLKLNQLGQGLNSVGESQNLSNSLLSTYGGNLTNLENAATNRYGVGGNLGLGAQSEANNVLGLGLNSSLSSQQLQNAIMQMGLGQLDTAGQQQLQNLYSGISAGNQGQELQLQNSSQGANILNSYLNSMLTGTNSILPFQQLQSSNMFNAGGMLNNTTGLQSNIQNSILSSYLNQAGGYQQGYGNILGHSGNLLQQLFSGYGQGAGILSGLGNAGLGYAQTGLSGLPHVFSNTFNASMNPLGNGLASGLAGIGTTLANILFPRGNNGGNGGGGGGYGGGGGWWGSGGIGPYDPTGGWSSGFSGGWGGGGGGFGQRDPWSDFGF